MKRTTPMSRTGILGQSSFQRLAAPAKPPKGPKLKKCAVRTCRSPYMPNAATPWVNWCSVDCGAVLGLEKIAKQKLAKVKRERAVTKAKLAQYETIPAMKARLQAVFNLYIRLRDDIAGYPCICCGKWPQRDASLTGGQWDACHWKGRGAHDHLRFNEDNVHRGLKDCNKYGHTDYRGGLVRRIGLDRVLALEADHAVVKWTREWLLERIAHYQKLMRELKKAPRLMEIAP